MVKGADAPPVPVWRVALIAGVAAFGLLTAVARAADPDALWKIVHGRCVPDEQTAHNPAPCAEVTADWAVLKDINGPTQHLLIPTARITGIESPAVLDPKAPNYFAAAWQARHFVEERAGHALPRENLSLEINPPSARSQEQFHIHVDCLAPDIRNALRTATIGTSWTMLPTPLAEQRYSAMRLVGDALEANPFQLLAGGIPGAKDAMGEYTLIVAGTPDGFIVLAGHVGADGMGHGEDLQDHSCALAHQP